MTALDEAPMVPAGRSHRREPETVVVCTPTHPHAALSSHGLSAGYDLLLEKPPTSWLGGFGELLALVAGTGRSVQVGLQTFGCAPSYAARCRGQRRDRTSDRRRCSGHLAALRELGEPLGHDRQTNHCRASRRGRRRGRQPACVRRGHRLAARRRDRCWRRRRDRPRPVSGETNFGASLHDRARSAGGPRPHAVRVRPDSAPHGRPRTHRTGSV
jgi:hypothetical protein